jgi:hypothetical protein
VSLFSVLLEAQESEVYSSPFERKLSAADPFFYAFAF